MRLFSDANAFGTLPGDLTSHVQPSFSCSSSSALPQVAARIPPGMADWASTLHVGQYPQPQWPARRDEGEPTVGAIKVSPSDKYSRTLVTVSCTHIAKTVSLV